MAHLRMTVYKGIGKHSSFSSPAINFERSKASIRLNMGYVDNINKMYNLNTYACDIRDGAFFGRQRHNLNKFSRGSQDDDANIISKLYA